MDDQLRAKLKRMYSTLEIPLDREIPEIQVFAEGGFLWDFGGTMKPHELEEILIAAVHNIAQLKDHLRKLAKNKGKDPEIVDDAVRSCFELQVILDLSNLDKHAGHDSRGGWSGCAPTIANVGQFLRSSSGKLTLGPQGISQGKVMITADIYATGGKKLGELPDFLQKGVAAWEDLFPVLGIELGG